MPTALANASSASPCWLLWQFLWHSSRDWSQLSVSLLRAMPSCLPLSAFRIQRSEFSWFLHLLPRHRLLKPAAADVDPWPAEFVMDDRLMARTQALSSYRVRTGTVQSVADFRRACWAYSARRQHGKPPIRRCRFPGPLRWPCCCGNGKGFSKATTRQMPPRLAAFRRL